MRMEPINGHLEDLKRQLKSRWTKLTQSDVDDVDLDVGTLCQVVAKRYAIPAKEARAQVDQFVGEAGIALKDVSNAVGDAAKELWRNSKEHISEAMHAGGEKAKDLWTSGREQLGQLGDRADRTVRDRPWTSMAIAAGAGLVLGFLLRPRR